MLLLTLATRAALRGTQESPDGVRARVTVESGQESRWSQDRSHSGVRTGVTVQRPKAAK